VEFEWDPDKATANLKRHRVDFNEAAGVLEDPLSTTFPDETHSEQEMRFLTIGASHRGASSSWPTRSETTPSGSSAPDQQRGASGNFMRKANRPEDDDLRPEYDFASMKGGVRGKYVARLRKGSNLVLLDPEVATAFPSAEAVNEALRGILNTTRAVRDKGGLPNKTLQSTRRRTARAKKPRRAGAARS
jgi:ribonuclease toxin BrnT of type II toxin-antitoxin system